MNELSLAAVNGKVDALGQVVGQLVMQISPQQAALVADRLAKARADIRTLAPASTPEGSLVAQELILDAFIELVAALSTLR